MEWKGGVNVKEMELVKRVGVQELKLNYLNGYIQ